MRSRTLDTDAKLEDLQAVSQHVLASAARVTELEAEKRTVDPNSARFDELSDEIERLAEEMRRISHAETALAHDIGDTPDLPTVADADASKR